MSRLRLQRASDEFRIRIRAAPEKREPQARIVIGSGASLALVTGKAKVAAKPFKASHKPGWTRTSKASSSPVTTRGGTMRGVLLREPPSWHQSVTVKASYKERWGAGEKADKSFAASLKRQVDYNTRSDADAKAKGAEPVVAFTKDADSVDAKDFTLEWVEDRRFWKFIISPEHGNKINDFRGYVRDVMDRVEKDVLTDQERKAGVNLEWLATIHDDTDHRHAHVMLRGRIGNQDLGLKPSYVSVGIRARASEVATKYLGYRMEPERETVVKDEVVVPFASLVRGNEAGWRLQVKLDTADADVLKVLRQGLKDTKYPSKFDHDRQELVVFAGTYERALMLGQVFEIGYAKQVQTPHADVINQGLQFGANVWGRFTAPASDERFAHTGAAGVPFVAEDAVEIAQGRGDIDRAVHRSNEMLNHHFRDRFVGNPDGGQPEAGWVVTIHSAQQTSGVVEVLREMDQQYRVDGDKVIVYAGSMDDAEQLAGTINDGLALQPHAQDGTKYVLADGVEARFLPSHTDMWDHANVFVNGVPLLHDHQDTTSIMGQERAIDDAVATLEERYGAYFAGSSYDDSASVEPPTQSDTPSHQPSRDKGGFDEMGM